MLYTKNIDDAELQRYAAVVLDDRTLMKHNLSNYVMTRKSKYGQICVTYGTDFLR